MKKSNKETLTCKCGKLIVLLHDKRESLHEDPVCDWFKWALEETKGRRVGRREALIDDTSIELGPLVKDN